MQFRLDSTYVNDLKEENPFCNVFSCEILLLIKRLQHGVNIGVIGILEYFPVTIAKFLRTSSYFEEHLLYVFQYPEAVVSRCSSK